MSTQVARHVHRLRARGPREVHDARRRRGAPRQGFGQHRRGRLQPPRRPDPEAQPGRQLLLARAALLDHGPRRLRLLDRHHGRRGGDGARVGRPPRGNRKSRRLLSPDES